MESKQMNRGLGAAKAAKQDEFYTQYVDIQKEVEAYLEFDPDTFRGKVVYCNCDDPFESNFFKYFAANFNKLGVKRLITTSYDGSPIAGQGTLFPEYDEGNGKRQKPKALAVILDHVKDEDGDGAANIDDVKLFLKRNKAARIALKADDKYGGGDFRSAECVELALFVPPQFLLPGNRTGTANYMAPEVVTGGALGLRTPRQARASQTPSPTYKVRANDWP
jgi:hypothetical protein